MRFNTYIPCDSLKPYVRMLAIAESAAEPAYKVLPDTGLTICLQYKINAAPYNNAIQFLSKHSGVTGLQDSYRVHENSSDIGAILVSFKAGCAAPFFRQPMHEFFRESVLLDNFMPPSAVGILEEQLGRARTDTARIHAVEQFLISQIKLVAQDKVVISALNLIQNSRGTIRIKNLLDQLQLSQSSLEKRFRAVVGAPPKKFASIVRFKHIIEQYNPQNSLTDLGYQAGFYDQAHFIKEFKSFTGQTPDTFFAKMG